MTEKLSIPVLIAALLAALLPVHGLRSSEVDTLELKEVSGALQELAAGEVQLNRQVTSRRVTAEELRRSVADLQQSLSELESQLSTSDPTVKQALENYSSGLLSLKKKTQSSIRARREFRTAVKEFSASLDRVLEVEADPEAREELASEARRFLVVALAGRDSVDLESVARLAGRIAWFGQRAEEEARGAFERAASAVEEVRVACRAREAALYVIQEVSLEEHRANLGRASLESLSRAAASSERAKGHALLAICTLLGILAVAVLRMRSVSIGMQGARENLEQRVKERTDQLVRMNQDLRDQMSERRKAELDTRAARNQAEVASQTKSEFLANMSHEIRTPMTAILGFSERLLEPALSSSDRSEAVDTIRRNGKYLLQIINDILDLSKIEAGKLQIERITAPTTDTAKEVLELMALRAEEKGLSLSVEYAGAVPQFIQTDIVRLRQILLNLVGNAIKFTRTGGVVIRVECIEEPYEMTDRLGNQFTGVKPFLKFSVVDTGIGMTEAQLALLFRPFTQADNSTTRNFGGTGLGLSISRSLCELLGGRIEVASRPGQGSRFTFTVDPGHLEGINFIEPASKNSFPVPELPSRVSDVHVEGECRVLLAEDGADNQRLVRYLLERAGATVTIVGNGQQALNHALGGWMDGDPYDVVLMDMQMPVMDGYTAVRELRAAGYDRPIIALTAHAMATDREKCLEIGCDAFCPKPIDKRELIGLLNQFGARMVVQEAAAGGVQAGGSGGGEPEDDPEMLELIQQFVEDLQADAVALRAAAEREDLDKIASLAHQLKGCAGGYGFHAIGEQAARVETLARSGASSEELQQELETLCTGCQQLKRRA